MQHSPRGRIYEEQRRCCVFSTNGRCPETQAEIACPAHLKEMADSGLIDNLLPGTTQIRNTPEAVRYIMAQRRLEDVPGVLIRTSRSEKK
jgi:hypothetical protein